MISDRGRVLCVDETDDDFSDRLQEAVDAAREEIERETEQYRQDLEKAYRAKVLPLIKHLFVWFEGMASLSLTNLYSYYPSYSLTVPFTSLTP